MAIPLLCPSGSDLQVGSACTKGLPRHARLRLAGETKTPLLDRAFVELGIADDMTPPYYVDLYRDGGRNGRPSSATAWREPVLATIGNGRATLHRVPKTLQWQPTEDERARLAAMFWHNPESKAGPKIEVEQAFKEDLDGDGVPERVFSVLRLPRYSDNETRVIVMRADESTTLLAPDDSGLRGKGSFVLGTSDIDHDGRREIILHEPCANDENVSIFEWPCDKPLFAYYRGNY